eukprot:12927845-Ditylum_brightwellii.AAC.1
MEALDILTELEARADPKNSIKVVNIFDKTEMTKEEVEIYVDLVWTDAEHRSATTPKYFKIFGTKPTDNPTLIIPRNQCRLKHVMLGLLLWNNLTPKLQLEMLTEEPLLKKEDNYDG